MRVPLDPVDSFLVNHRMHSGRTGKMFAYEWDNVAPDIMSLAKGLGGGFPIGAILSSKEASKGMVPGTHGSTFGGNYLACVAARTVLNHISQPNFFCFPTYLKFK